MTDYYEMPHPRADECRHAGVGKACRPCRDRFESEHTPEVTDAAVEALDALVEIARVGVVGSVRQMVDDFAKDVCAALAAAPAPTVVPEDAIEALREWDVDESDVTALREAAVEAAAWKLIDRTSDLSDRGPSDETVQAALTATRAALPFLTAAPSATREEVARTVADATYCAYCAGDCDDCTHAADALLARFNITQKKVR